MKEVCLLYEERSWGGDALSDEPYSSREDKHIEFTVTGLSPSSTGGLYQETIEVEEVKFPLYVIVVRYSTGDSFGNTNGAWHVEGAYTDADKVQEIVDAINNDTYKSKCGYEVWKGYFERLENVEVHEFSDFTGRSIKGASWKKY